MNYTGGFSSRTPVWTCEELTHSSSKITLGLVKVITRVKLDNWKSSIIFLQMLLGLMYCWHLKCVLSVQMLLGSSGIHALNPSNPLHKVGTVFIQTLNSICVFETMAARRPQIGVSQGGLDPIRQQPIPF